MSCTDVPTERKPVLTTQQTARREESRLLAESRSSGAHTPSSAASYPAMASYMNSMGVGGTALAAAASQAIAATQHVSSC